MDVIFYIVSILFYKIIYLHTKLLGHWDESQVMIFVGGYLLADAFYMTVFANNMWWFPFFVNKGDLDYYLTRPISSLFFLSVQNFAADSFMNLIMAIGVLVWALGVYPVHFSFSEIFIFVLLLANGAYITYLIKMILTIPVFWLHTDRGLNKVYLAIEHSKERPDSVFRGWMRKLLVFVIPFAVVASYPTRVLLDSDPRDYIIQLVCITLFFTFFMIGFWRIGLKNYSSASS